jgi:hypothetical protein
MKRKMAALLLAAMVLMTTAGRKVAAAETRNPGRNVEVAAILNR